MGNLTLEEHLLNHRIVLDKADETHANPIFYVKTHEQASNSKLFAVYRVRAWLYLLRSPICDLTLFVREKIARKPVSTYSQIVETNMLYSTSTIARCSSCAFIYRISSRGSSCFHVVRSSRRCTAAFILISLPPAPPPAPPPTTDNPICLAKIPFSLRLPCLHLPVCPRSHSHPRSRRVVLVWACAFPTRKRTTPQKYSW
jgi:hypothetical protein